ncbi:lipopolysaccharide biosynthesis protein [Vogesella indigofera]|uniref:lipopolysaccharide biosynthesis protein n=1 Tax=Vogesella indigofera TaxID=45465 RepID=UPI003F41E807
MNAKAVSLQVAVMLVGIIKGFLILKIMTSFGAEEYALLSQFLVVASFSVQLMFLSYDAAFVSQISSGTNSRQAYQAIAFLFVVNAIILFFGCFFFGGNLAYVIFGDGRHVDVMMFFCFYILAQAFNLITLLGFQGSRNFKAYALFQMAQQLLQLLAVFLGTSLKSGTLLLVFLISAEVFLFFCGRSNLRHFFIEIKSIRARVGWIKENLSVAAPLFFAFMMIWLVNNGGRLAVVHQGGLLTLASYSATLSIAVLSGILINPLCSVFFPYFSASKNEAASAALAGKMTLLIFSGAAGLFIILLSEPVLSVLAKKELFSGSMFVFFVCVGQVFYGQARILSLYSVVNGMASHGSKAFFGGAIALIMMLFLVSGRGVVWVAASFAIANLTTVFLLMPVVMKILSESSFVSKRNSLFKMYIFVPVFLYFMTFVESHSVYFSCIMFFVALSLFFLGVFLVLRKEPFLKEGLMGFISKFSRG